ncbi:MAG: PHB depolymerase family esterase [Pseudomonadota bacterium]
MRYFLCLFALLIGPSLAAQACGPDAPCEIDGGSYHVLLPEGWADQGPKPALMFYHGHNATGAMVFRSGGLARDFVDQGYVVIAPNGTRIQGRQTRRWAGRMGAGRDDVAFSLAVLEDARARFGIDPARTYAAGFSAGGSMVWLMACKSAGSFAGYLSLSGALRQPNDITNCPETPVRVLHIHGFADAQVPLEGRVIGNWHQGSVWDSLRLARRAGQCRSNPDRIEMTEEYRCRQWDDSCAAGGSVQLCLRDGGHGMPKGWTAMAREFFESG